MKSRSCDVEYLWGVGMWLQKSSLNLGEIVIKSRFLYPIGKTTFQDMERIKTMGPEREHNSVDGASLCARDQGSIPCFTVQHSLQNTARSNPNHWPKNGSRELQKQQQKNSWELQKQQNKAFYMVNKYPVI